MQQITKSSMHFFKSRGEKITFIVAFIYCLVSSWVLYAGLACGEFWDTGSFLCRLLLRSDIAIVPFIPALLWFQVYFDMASWVNQFNQWFENPIFGLVAWLFLIFVFARVISWLYRGCGWAWSRFRKTSQQK